MSHCTDNSRNRLKPFAEMGKSKLIQKFQMHCIRIKFPQKLVFWEYEKCDSGFPYVWDNKKNWENPVLYFRQEKRIRIAKM